MSHGQVVFTVKKSAHGAWAVCESGFDKALAEFNERDDALDYARGLAATKPRATVDAPGDDQAPGVNESYALDPVSGKSERVSA